MANHEAPTPEANDRAAVQGIGLRLRTLRERAGLTLAAVSARTDISVSTLSRLESGDRRATLELLLPLSRCYEVTLDELVTLPTLADPRITPTITTRGDQLIQNLTRRSSRVQIFRTRIQGGTGETRRHHTTEHPGFDWVYVLSGRLLLVLGEREFVLERGQAAEFDTRTPHWFGAADSRPVDYLSLFSPEGEQAHLHDGER